MTGTPRSTQACAFATGMAISTVRKGRDTAAWLRDDAQIDCDAERWEPCRRRLDEAAGIDPSGEGEPRVVKMREAIAAGLAAVPGDAGRTP
jgi:hypothetical protein